VLEDEDNKDDAIIGVTIEMDEWGPVFQWD
jgi:hypothetical protein